MAMNEQGKFQRENGPLLARRSAEIFPAGKLVKTPTTDPISRFMRRLGSNAGPNKPRQGFCPPVIDESVQNCKNQNIASIP